ncbi:alpha/beta hydrolase [uncultured Rhodoferax sp.]|uniref:alpha/beta fold hydrolase n=1 Tax=uncultured Rhodoferax sp. TaxID=223188 RepID=UPI0025FD7884|nr:alpha/beta hydrolase [uncultured Rhodoferax sp.]
MKYLLRLLLVVLVSVFVFLLAGLLATWAPDRPVQQLTARWAQPPSTWLEIAGMRVHLRDEGPRDDKEPIVLLHGTSASLHTWDGWADNLKAQRRVIRFDLPGYGLTGPSPNNDYTVDAYVRLVVQVMDALKVQRFVLVGNSLGGQIAWATAVAQPRRVSQLVLIDSAGYPIESQSVPVGFQVARLPVLRSLMEYVLPRGVIQSSLRNVYGDPSKVTPELVDRYYELTLRAGNRAALARRFEQGLSGDTSQLKTLTMPSLVLWGGRDRLIPPDNAQKFARDLPHARVQLFDDLGHVPQEEDPQRTVQALRAFLNI